MTARTSLMTVAVVAAFTACECGGPDTEGGASGSAAVQAEAPPAVSRSVQVVRFTHPRVVLGELENPVAPPVTIESSPSPLTMVSDRPGVVTVDDQGRLVAHAEGRAVVHGLDRGSSLIVDVIVADGIRMDPSIIRLEMNENARVRVLTATGAALPPEAVEWWSSSPQLAKATNGIVYAGAAAGEATIEARFGPHSARGRVLVMSPSGVDYAVTPARPRARVGEVLSFEARSPEGPIDVEWSSAEERIIKQLQAGVFWAAAAGRAAVCGRHGDRRVCTTVEVVP